MPPLLLLLLFAMLLPLLPLLLPALLLLLLLPAAPMAVASTAACAASGEYPAVASERFVPGWPADQRSTSGVRAVRGPSTM